VARVLLVQYNNPDLYPTTRRFARCLGQRGKEVTVACVDDGTPFMDHTYGPGIELARETPRTPARPPFRGARFPEFVARVVARAVRTRPDVVVGYDTHGGVAGLAAARASGARYVYHCYDVALSAESGGKSVRWLLPLERRCAVEAEAVVLPSESKAAVFVQEHRLKREVLVVANSAELQPRRRTTRLRDELRARGFDPSHVVVSHGSMGRGKGLRETVLSMRWWPPRAALVLIGLMRPAELWQELVACAASVGAGERVHFLGFVPPTELYDLTVSADLGLFTPTSTVSNHTTSGAATVKLNDYMACAVPFVVSDMPALAELARDTGAGVTVDMGDVEAMGRAIGSLLEDDGRRAAMADRAYQAHVTKYNLEAQLAPLGAAVPGLLETT